MFFDQKDFHDEILFFVFSLVEIRGNLKNQCKQLTYTNKQLLQTNMIST